MKSHFTTSDLSVAAFVFMKGLEVQVARRMPSGKFRFEFTDPDDVGDQLRIEYANSECRKFDAAIRALKQLCFDKSGG